MLIAARAMASTLWSLSPGCSLVMLSHGKKEKEKKKMMKNSETSAIARKDGHADRQLRTALPPPEENWTRGFDKIT